MKIPIKYELPILATIGAIVIILCLWWIAVDSQQAMKEGLEAGYSYEQLHKARING